MNPVKDELSVAAIQIFEELLDVATTSLRPTCGDMRLVIVSSYFGTWETALHGPTGLRHLQFVNTLACLIDQRAGVVHRGFACVWSGALLRG